MGKMAAEIYYYSKKERKSQTERFQMQSTKTFIMMICCRCNVRGRSKNCQCARGKKACLDCISACLGNCENLLTSNIIIDEIYAPIASEESPSSANKSFLNPTELSSHYSQESQNIETYIQVPLESLPSFPNLMEPNFMWRDLDGVTFTKIVNDKYYYEIIGWRRNLFICLAERWDLNL